MAPPLAQSQTVETSRLTNVPSHPVSAGDQRTPMRLNVRRACVRLEQPLALTAMVTATPLNSGEPG